MILFTKAILKSPVSPGGYPFHHRRLDSEWEWCGKGDLTSDLTRNKFLLLAMISSKGSSGVTGAGFITLAATLAVVPKVPLASLALLVGIDRFMSECRAITNLIGNGVATAAFSRWEMEISAETVRNNLRGESGKPAGQLDGNEPVESSTG